MRLENTEHNIDLRPNECGLEEVIIITREALEKWCDHYLNESYEIPEAHPAREFMVGFCKGKASVLCDLLKHFEDDEE